MKFSEIDPLLVEIVVIDILLEYMLDYQPPKSSIRDHFNDCFGWAITL